MNELVVTLHALLLQDGAYWDFLNWLFLVHVPNYEIAIEPPAGAHPLALELLPIAADNFNRITNVNMLLLESANALEVVGRVVHSDVALVVTAQQLTPHRIVFQSVNAVIMGLLRSAGDIFNEDVLLAQVELIDIFIRTHVHRGLHVRRRIGQLVRQAGVTDHLDRRLGPNIPQSHSPVLRRSQECGLRVGTEPNEILAVRWSYRCEYLIFA